MDKKEIWKPIPNFSGYEVSNLGNIKSYLKLGPGWDFNKKSQIRKTQIGTNGYLSLFLYSKDKEKKFFTVGSLVLLTFIGPCPPKKEICHNDGDRLNNKLSNLRYDSRKNNHKDKKKHGTQKCGQDHYLSKYSDNDIKEMRYLYLKGTSQFKIAELFGTNQSYISLIVNNKRR